MLNFIMILDYSLANLFRMALTLRDCSDSIFLRLRILMATSLLVCSLMAL